jgi:hypothetical protein
MDRLEAVAKLSLGFALMALAGAFYWAWSKIKVYPCPECNSKLVMSDSEAEDVNECLDCGHAWTNEN